MRLDGRAVRDVRLLREHVLRERQHDGSGPARDRDRERLRHVLGDPLGTVELPRRLRDAAEDLRVVELLPRLAPAERTRHLADEQDHRRRVLLRGMDADRGLRRTGTARDEADPGPARQLPVRLGRVRGALLVATRDEAYRRVVERVEHGQVALPREAEREVGAVELELVDEDADPRSSQRHLEEDGRALESRPVLVGGIDVADRAAPRPIRPGGA